MGPVKFTFKVVRFTFKVVPPRPFQKDKVNRE